MLTGKRVVNTRSPHQGVELDALLRARGAEPLPFPCIDIEFPHDAEPLDQALREAVQGGFDWLVFTSANAVAAVEARMKRLGLSTTSLAGSHVAAIGPATASLVKSCLGLSVDMQPESYTAEVLAKQLAGSGAKRMLVPQSDQGRKVLEQTLAASGIDVVVVTAYRTVLGSGGVDLPALLKRDEVDAIVFTSPSTVKNLAVRLDKEGGSLDDLLGVCVACIGPVTADAAAALGLQVNVQPDKHTISALVEGLEEYFAAEPGRRPHGKDGE